jgi:hypothetical protein
VVTLFIGCEPNIVARQLKGLRKTQQWDDVSDCRYRTKENAHAPVLLLSRLAIHQKIGATFSLLLVRVT